MTFINQLLSNPWISLFSLFIGILGIIISYRSIPQKKIKYIIRNNELITNKQSVLSNLDIQYNGIKIDKLTVTKITFWNGSFPTINSSDIINADPISLRVTNGELLDFSILNGDKSPNQIELFSSKNDCVNISFDYLDRKEGGIIQIIHTGNENSIDISKRIKGGKIVPSTAEHYAKVAGTLSVTFAALSLFIPQLIDAMSIQVSLNILNIIMNLFYIISLTITFLLWFKLKNSFIPKNCMK